MIDYKNHRKIISIMVIMAFVCHFHSAIFLHAQETDELLKLFNKAKSSYINGQYVDSTNKLELVIGIITEEGLEVEKKEIPCSHRCGESSCRGGSSTTFW